MSFRELLHTAVPQYSQMRCFYFVSDIKPSVLAKIIPFTPYHVHGHAMTQVVIPSNAQAVPTCKRDVQEDLASLDTEFRDIYSKISLPRSRRLPSRSCTHVSILREGLVIFFHEYIT